MKMGAVKDWVGAGERMNFGEIKLKPMQMAILKCNREHDVLVNLPTGFGKSLLFQYPASLLTNKCIVVFVPLKALLWDCLKEAELHNLTAVECDSAFIKKYEAHGFLPQLLFLTPERLFQNQMVMAFLDCLNEEKRIELFVIDEAHCISEWGSDFRPDYARLGQIRTLFPGTRMLGMSATIPPQALKDLISRLQITGCYYFQSSSNRPNLIYQVMSCEKGKVAGNIIDYIKQKNLKEESGIVYCQTIKNAEEVYKELTRYDFNCCLFHSKLPERKREQNFDRFMRGEIKCIVATICFGMGVNKKNIRYVINAGVSLSAENYYQESGRAGRDGEMSFCLLLTYGSDLAPLTFLIGKSTTRKILIKRKLYKLQQLKVYTKARDCRKRTLFKLLGEDFSVEDCRKTCDFCIDDRCKNEVFESVDYSSKGFRIIEEMQLCKESITKTQLVGHLKGRDIIKNKIIKEKYRGLFQLLKDEKNENIELLVDTMISKGLLIPFSQKIKAGRFPRYVEYLKACTKTEFLKQKPQGLHLSVSVTNKFNESKTNKEHIPNPYVTKKFQKYVLKKSKSFDAPEFELEVEKQPNIEMKEEEDLKQIKMIEIGPDYQKFFDELFPENTELMKGNASEDVDECDLDDMEKLEISEVPKEDDDEELENPYLEMVEPKRLEKHEIAQNKQKQDKQRMQSKTTSTEQVGKESDDSFEDSLFQQIKRKKEELNRKKEEEKKEVVKRKIPFDKFEFL